MGGKGKEIAKKTRVLTQTKAGLKFPVKRIHKFLRKYSRKTVSRVSTRAGIAIASFCEYMSAELLEGAINELKDYNTTHSKNKTTLKPKFLFKSMDSDEELAFLKKECHFRQK